MVLLAVTSTLIWLCSHDTLIGESSVKKHEPRNLNQVQEASLREHTRPAKLTLPPKINVPSVYHMTVIPIVVY